MQYLPSLSQRCKNNFTGTLSPAFGFQTWFFTQICLISSTSRLEWNYECCSRQLSCFLELEVTTRAAISTMVKWNAFRRDLNACNNKANMNMVHYIAYTPKLGMTQQCWISLLLERMNFLFSSPTVRNSDTVAYIGSLKSSKSAHVKVVPGTSPFVQGSTGSLSGCLALARASTASSTLKIWWPLWAVHSFKCL